MFIKSMHAPGLSPFLGPPLSGDWAIVAKSLIPRQGPFPQGLAGFLFLMTVYGWSQDTMSAFLIYCRFLQVFAW